MLAPGTERPRPVDPSHPRVDLPWAQERPAERHTDPLELISFRTGEHGYERTESGLVDVYEYGQTNNRFTYGRLGELHFQIFVAPGTPFNLDRNYVVGLGDASQRVLTVWQQRKAAVEMIKAGRNSVSEAAAVLAEYLRPEESHLLQGLGTRFSELNGDLIAKEFAKSIDRVQAMGVERIETFFDGKVSEKFDLTEGGFEAWLPAYSTKGRAKLVFPG